MEGNHAKISVPVSVRRAADLAGAVARAAEIGDFVEIRFDGFAEGELSGAIEEYTRLHSTAVKPFIVTFRPRDEGGSRPLSIDERVAFWNQIAGISDRSKRSGHDFADVEFQHLTSPAWNDQIAPERIICSYHDFVGVPDDLNELYGRMAVTPAAVLKIAVQANDATDCISIFQLLERAQRDGRELIAIAIGQAGVMTRVLGPSRGSFLTYGSLKEDSATAPGQFTVRELREMFHIDKIDRQTEVMGIIGRPVAHSISPHIHNAVFAEGSVNAVFIPIEVKELDSFMRRMVRESAREIEWNLRGLSVTAPHKTAVMKHLDWIDPAVKEIGAVNTIVVQEGALRGYNTDAIGFLKPLAGRVDLRASQCAVIGAGGAARAAVWALRNQGATVTLFARTPEKANGIAGDFGIALRPLVNATFGEFDLVINATPLGTRGATEAETSATADQLRDVRLAYDLVYNPLETRFMREARDAGCETIGGLEMLIGQAVEQFKLWTGVEPRDVTMRRAALAALK